MKIPIEDYFEDIVGKAMSGTETADDALAVSAGLSIAAIQSLRRGEGDESTARAVAPHLGLNPDKLADAFTRRWYPESRSLNGLFMANTPFADMLVNAYLVWDPAGNKGAFFDTGSDASTLIEHARTKELDIDHIFLTHTHRDHIMDLDRLCRAYPAAEVFVGEREPLPAAHPVHPGDRFETGALRISARLTWGHSPGGITYVVGGLDTPLAIVGDAVFAGSMGGGRLSYADALRTNRDEILSLPDETIICPGHGPLTTVAEEKAHNPFF